MSIAGENETGPEVSIIIPCYNEAENIPILLRGINEVLKGVKGLRFECVVVNDGSGDDTEQVLASLRQDYSWLVPVSLVRNRGQSYALWMGLKQSRGGKIVIMDGDLQNDPADIPRLLELMNEADFVQGYRVQRRDDFLRSWVSRQANRLIRYLLGTPVRDTGCGLKAMRRECVEYLIPFNGSHRFYAFLVHAAGFKVVEVPVNHHPRQFGYSKYSIGNRLFRTLFDIVGLLWWKKRVLRRE